MDLKIRLELRLKKLSNTQENSLWAKLFPLKVGDKVRFTQITSSEASDKRKEMLHKIGKIQQELGESRKKQLIAMGFYPKNIMEEKCYLVTFPKYPTTSFNFRQIELEKVIEDEE